MYKMKYVSKSTVLVSISTHTYYSPSPVTTIRNIVMSSFAVLKVLRILKL